ncbi:hypothetical protein ABIA33_007121 [Streptacidiphilus sp. MAP12-16]
MDQQELPQRLRNRTLPVGRTIGITAAFGSIALVCALGVYCAVNGINPDPTDPEHYSSVTFMNDTQIPVRLFECTDNRGHDCHDMTGGVLASGERSAQQVWWGPGLSSWQVRSAEGRPIGWVMVATTQRESGAVYNLGDATTGVGRATTPRVSPSPAPVP